MTSPTKKETTDFSTKADEDIKGRLPGPVNSNGDRVFYPPRQDYSKGMLGWMARQTVAAKIEQDQQKQAAVHNNPSHTFGL